MSDIPMRLWDDLITVRDRVIYEAVGMGQRTAMGESPVLLIIDVTYEFTGDREEATEESVKRFPFSCGEAAWHALPVIRMLLEEARAAHVPVIYTRQAPRPNALVAGAWAQKNARVLDAVSPRAESLDHIPDMIAPGPEDIVIDKDKPSAFFGTPLESYLNELRADTLIVAGTSTSGCVRATVVDAFSYNYRVFVVEDGVFDRGEISHKVNLFDMQAKYADVESAAAIRDRLRVVAARPSTPARAPAG